MGGFADLESFLNAEPVQSPRPKAAVQAPAIRTVVQAKPALLPQAPPPSKTYIRKRLNVGEIGRIKAVIAERKLEGVPCETHVQILQVLTMLDERQAADERDDKARASGGFRQGSLI